jgi:AcrR family transcriptional regulator
MALPASSLASERPGEATRERLLAAAGAVFAARGYRGATMREIAERAKANLASAHYHFGSKEELYLEVARRQFEELEERFGRDRALAREDSPRQAFEEQLAARIRAMVELLLETPGHYGQLMQRELCDPSEALPVIVKRFIDPLRREMDRLIARLEPTLSLADVERCTRSIVGQIFFYVSHRPALLLMLGRERYPRGFEESMALHVTRFSLAGIAAVAATARSTGAGRPRPTRKGSA